MYLIQLPDDVKSVGYKQTNSFHYDQIFHSPKNNFTGTEKEFLEHGFAYSYVQLDPYRRSSF